MPSVCDIKKQIYVDLTYRISYLKKIQFNAKCNGFKRFPVKILHYNVKSNNVHCICVYIDNIVSTSVPTTSDLPVITAMRISTIIIVPRLKLRLRLHPLCCCCFSRENSSPVVKKSYSEKG